ncbi:uncharacterized protein LOC110984064 [Acanthaster planci]|uniref:Uncharacterized protein LOC110984064 n=1 Tax=Acanthaster planci TaxID=133434 RepID=A0A8B7Z3M6_ACAPL|nr:uncharacterized protein LOC110984064 [Acanthaster planci]
MRMACGDDGNNLVVSHREASLQGQDEMQILDQKFRRALCLTRDVCISKMHREDIQLLNKAMHEKAQLLNTSNRFHYIKLAYLFDISRDEARSIESAEGVLDYLKATREVELTVAEFLQKLKNCKQCYDVVRKLVDQIINRG